MKYVRHTKNLSCYFTFFNTSSPFYVFEPQCFERALIFYQSKLQFEDQVTRKTYPWSIKTQWKTDNFDQQISLEADDNIA